MTSEISKHWFVHPPSSESPISLRALKPAGWSLNLYPVNRTYHPRDYQSLEALKAAFERDALALNERGYNIYTVMNRIRTDLFYNRAVKDDDIIERTKILIDIDRVGDTSNPATDAEVQASFDLAQVICGFLTSKDFPQPKWVHSGNGTHLYLDLEPCTSDVLDSMTVGRLLKGLAEQFNNDVVGVDTTVFNAARITKVIGTVARKGKESEGRPFRIARLL